MYCRESQMDGVMVEWKPEDDELAAEAMRNVEGTGVPNSFSLPDDAPVPVEEEVAQAVRDEYRRLVEESQ